MVKAVIFDMGGTLEDVIHTDEYKVPCGEKILAYLKKNDISIPMSAGDFMDKLSAKNKEYRKWGLETRREISPYELWSQWYMDGFSYNDARLRVIAENLADIWERTYYHRELRPDAKPMLQGLKDQGIRMGVISNTASQTQVIEILHEYNIRHYFDSVYLSSLSGFRKPHPELFYAASASLDVKPGESIYVGDTISRDVRGARGAGYFAVIRINSHLTALSDAMTKIEEDDADYVIGNLQEIVGIVKKINA